MNWYLKVIKSAFDFSSRARRKEYWMFVLYNMIISFVLMMLDKILGLSNPQTGFGLLSGLYTIAIIIPSLAVVVRRLHDTNKSGWMILLGLIPFVGGIILLVFMVKEGDRRDNTYGPNPKMDTENINLVA